jgi:predicted nucleotidyltransferase
MAGARHAPLPLKRGQSMTDIRELVDQYVGALRSRIAGSLREIWLFGSAARADMWPDWDPSHSDIDLLVVTESELDEGVREVLVNETYTLFLAYGRQISPQWRTTAWMDEPPDEKARGIRPDDPIGRHPDRALKSAE